VHIIQTFFSEELAEEIQIKGRTARQKRRGSYQLVLFGKDLKESFKLTPEEQEKMLKTGNNYAILNDKRSELSRNEGKRRTKQVESALQAHETSMSYLKALAELNSVRFAGQPVLVENKRLEIWKMLRNFQG
jgi:hypothetical protein